MTTVATRCRGIAGCVGKRQVRVAPCNPEPAPSAPCDAIPGPAQRDVYDTRTARGSPFPPHIAVRKGGTAVRTPFHSTSTYWRVPCGSVACPSHRGSEGPLWVDSGGSGQATQLPRLWVEYWHSNQRATDADALAKAGWGRRVAMSRLLTDTLASGYATSASSTGEDATLSRQWFDATGASPPSLSSDAAVTIDRLA